MKIAFVTQWYDPEVGSAAIPGAIVRALQARGHDVEVVTGFPNYPHGRLYPGYRVKPYQREVVRGVPVHRVPLYPSHDSSAPRRILNFLTFMVSASTLGALFARRAQVALVYSTPGTVGMAGVVLRRLLRKPFVLYIQDVWPDTVTATGMLPARWTRPAEWLLHGFSDLVYRAAGHIAVISPGMKDLLVSRGVPPQKISVAYNWVDEDYFRPVETRTATDRFDLMYAGNLGDVQGLDVAIRALAMLADLPQVHLRLVGDGVARDRLQSLADGLGVADRTHFEGTATIDAMAGLMATAHAQLVCLSDQPLFHLTMPSKIQAILACGRPIVCSAPGDASRLVVASGAGVAAEAGSASALADAIRSLVALPDEEREALGQRGYDYYQDSLSARAGTERLEHALESASHLGVGNV